MITAPESPSSPITPSSSTRSITAGPSLRFRGQTEEKVWKVSMMLVINNEPDREPRLPKVSLGKKTPMTINGKILDEKNNKLFLLYEFPIQQKDRSQGVNYSVNHQNYKFNVPGVIDSARCLFYSCNGYQSTSAKERLGGIQPMWNAVKKIHEVTPYHVGCGGGDQVYNDGLVNEKGEPTYHKTHGVFALPSMQKWLAIESDTERDAHPFTDEMREEITSFYINHYSRQWNEPEFKDILASIPSLMQWDDHDIFDGYGSYPESLQNSDVFKGIFNISKDLYLLFQQHSSSSLSKKRDLFGKEGFSFLHTINNGEVAILGVDTRTERTRNQVVNYKSWEKIFHKLDKLPENCKHILVMLSVPIIYPSLNIMDKMFQGLDNTPLLGWLAGMIPGAKNHFRLWELEDDGRDHWSHEDHLTERNQVFNNFQKFAEERGNVRVSFLGGDVHIGAAGRVFNLNTDLEDRNNPRVLYQVTSSPIGNEVPPPLVSAALGRMGGCKVIKDSDGNKTDNAMELIPFRKIDEPKVTKTLIDKRNFSTLVHDRDAGLLHVYMNAEPKPDGKNAGQPHRVYQLDIPDCISNKNIKTILFD